MQCSVETSDEIGKLSEAFNGFMISLRGLIFNVNDVSDHVNQKSIDIENSITHAIKGDQLDLKGIIHLKQQF